MYNATNRTRQGYVLRNILKLAGRFFLWGQRVNYNKPYLSVPDQITLLKSRGMQFGDEANAERYLQHTNYVRLRTYWYLFENNHATHQFKPNTTFEAVLNIYLFDRALRAHLAQAIETIEISLRTQYAYQFARLHGPFAYADVANSKDRRHFQNNLNQLQEEIGRSNEVFIAHYGRKYTAPNMPPIWMACEVMSFGLLSRWYKNLKLGQVRQAIAHVYGVDNRSLDGILHNFTELRNVIAHHGRLWDRNIIFRLPLPQNKPRNLRACMNLRQQDLIYNSLVMVLHFLDLIQPGHAWRAQLVTLLTDYQVDTTAMGFPTGWQALSIWGGN